MAFQNVQTLSSSGVMPMDQDVYSWSSYRFNRLMAICRHTGGEESFSLGSGEGDCAVGLGLIIGEVKFMAVDLGLWYTCFCIALDEGSLCYAGEL